jgi:hypothetical protein
MITFLIIYFICFFIVSLLHIFEYISREQDPIGRHPIFYVLLIFAPLTIILFIILALTDKDN